MVNYAGTEVEPAHADLALLSAARRASKIRAPDLHNIKAGTMSQMPFMPMK